MVKFKIPIKDILGLSYYRYELTSNNYNPQIGETITITCTVTNVFGNPVKNKTITLYQNGSSLGNKTTNTTGIATWNTTINNGGEYDFNVTTQHLIVTSNAFISQTIPSNSDLNNYKTEGFYYSPNVATTDSLTNCPVTNTGFSLIVEKHTGYRQTLITRDKNNPITYTRSFFDNAWSDWIKPNAWRTVSVNKGTLYINENLRLANFLYGENVNITTASSWQTVRTANIPSDYRFPNRYITMGSHNNPSRDFTCITMNGDLQVWSNTTGTKTFNCNMTWHY